MKLFEVFLSPGANASALLTEEAIQASGAQIFSEQEAELVGLEGIPDNPSGETRVFIACGNGDERFVATRLEAAAGVARYRLHEV